MEKNNYSGAKLENRSAKDQKKDYSLKELIGSTGSLGMFFMSENQWLDKDQALKAIKEFRDQGQTSSCGAHAGELVMSDFLEGKYSQAKLYRNRKNYPDEGMYLYDIGDILVNLGVGKWIDVKTTEEAFNSISKDFNAILKAKAYTLDATPTIDELAYISNILELPQIVLLYSKDGKEYGQTIPVADPKFSDPNKARIRHFVRIPPKAAFVEDGKKYVLIQDSAAFGKIYVRQFSEDWINRRILHSASYFELDKEQDKSAWKQNYKNKIPQKDLDVGSKGVDVQMLQEILQKLGHFPNTIPCTGYFGGITRQAVKDFQKANEKSILWPIGLRLPTGIYSRRTRSKLIEIINE